MLPDRISSARFTFPHDHYLRSSLFDIKIHLLPRRTPVKAFVSEPRRIRQTLRIPTPINATGHLAPWPWIPSPAQLSLLFLVPLSVGLLSEEGALYIRVSAPTANASLFRFWCARKPARDISRHGSQWRRQRSRGRQSSREPTAESSRKTFRTDIRKSARTGRRSGSKER